MFLCPRYLNRQSLFSLQTKAKTMKPDIKTDETTEIFQEWQQKRRYSNPKPSVHEEGRRQSISKPLPQEDARASNSRRRSTFKGIASSISGLLNLRRQFSKHRNSLVASDQQKPVQKLENTYRLKPSEGTEFKEKNVQDFVRDLLERGLRDEKYNSKTCSKAACDLSIVIKSKIKEMNFPRYKIICQVFIGQMGHQSMQTASRCLWDDSTDRCTTVAYKNSSLWAVATIHAVYFE